MKYKCKACGLLYCICDDEKDHPEIRNSKKLFRQKVINNNEKYGLVKRYGIMSNSHDSWIIESEKGEYVKYSDYEILLNKLNEN